MNLFNLLYTIIVTVINGIWVVYKFKQRNELTSLNVKIDKIELMEDFNLGKKYLLIEIILQNRGKREVRLFYDYVAKKEFKKKYEELNKFYKAELKVYKITSKEGKEIIYKKTGLDFDDKKRTGRLRTGVEFRTPYLVPINKPGIYYCEFTIDVDMKTYYNGKDFKDKPIKQWIDSRYENINFTINNV